MLVSTILPVASDRIHQLSRDLGKYVGCVLGSPCPTTQNHTVTGDIATAEVQENSLQSGHPPRQVHTLAPGKRGGLGRNRALDPVLDLCSVSRESL
jgi:hypothetical protein